MLLRSFHRPLLRELAAALVIDVCMSWTWTTDLGGQGGNANWSNWSRASVLNRSIALQQELSSHWNYAIELDAHGCCSEAQNRTIALANAHPGQKGVSLRRRACHWPSSLRSSDPHGASLTPVSERHLSAIIMRIQEPDDYLTRNQTLPNGCYLQDASGKFITCAGAETAHKILRPTTPELALAEGCPDTVFAHDGNYFRDIFRRMDAQLTRPINMINEDGEIFVPLSQCHYNEYYVNRVCAVLS
jgi:hypothetical protein